MTVRVYKLGGPALEDPRLIAPLAAELMAVPGHKLLVHGGGRHIDRLLATLRIESSFVSGRRETSVAAMEVIEMVLSGTINKGLASELTRVGVPAVGISGRDGGLLTARVDTGLGRVGVAVRVKPDLILGLWSAGFLPVVSPVSNGPSGESLNVNADEAALALASALGARSLFYLSDVDGVRVGGETATELTPQAAKGLIEDGSIAGGMALKVRAALAASEAGIGEVVIAGRARLEGGFSGTRIVGFSKAQATA
jgi:acetylglutamate kinase